MQREGNSLKELEARQRHIPFTPSETSYRMGWKALQAVRYRNLPDSGEFSLPSMSLHRIMLQLRSPEKFNLRIEELKLDRPLPAGSITVVPARSLPRSRWQGNRDMLVIYLEPSIAAPVATESFGLDPTRTVVPPLAGLNAPELRSAMLAVDAELRAGDVGGALLAESLANILAVHLIRHITRPHRPKASPDGVLPRHKLRTVIDYIMENLEGNPTLEEMAAIVHLSPYHFARQFKAATGLAPYQFVISRRIERAQHLLQANNVLPLAEVAFRCGFANQSNFCLHFKRIVGVTPRQFRFSAPARKQRPTRRNLPLPGAPASRSSLPDREP